MILLTRRVKSLFPWGASVFGQGEEELTIRVSNPSFREGLYSLFCCPALSLMQRDDEMQDQPKTIRPHDEHDKRLELHDGDAQEIDNHRIHGCSSFRQGQVPA